MKTMISKLLVLIGITLLNLVPGKTVAQANPYPFVNMLAGAGCGVVINYQVVDMGCGSVCESQSNVFVASGASASLGSISCFNLTNCNVFVKVIQIGSMVLSVPIATDIFSGPVSTNAGACGANVTLSLAGTGGNIN